MPNLSQLTGIRCNYLLPELFMASYYCDNFFGTDTYYKSGHMYKICSMHTHDIAYLM